MSFLAEIKRRKVFHVAVVYAVVSWLLVQIVVTIEAPLNLPDWFDTAMIVLLAVCFPLAMILSWVFAWTPQGLVRDSGSNESRPIPEAQALPDEAQDESEAGQESRSLRELIVAGPISISRLLSLAVRIAESLAGAHANEEVHGSLRPARILVSGADRVELVGFGEPDGGSPEDAADASAYRAPERTRGAPPDKSSDQFALGAILYEMATGRRAFDAAGEADTRAAVLHVDPEPVSRFNPEIPMPLQWAIERCLSKNAADRYPTTRDLCTDLASIARTVTTASSGRSGEAHNLPAQRTALIGRDHELSEIKQVVLRGHVRLVTLTGAGGIGKTRLLIELGRQISKNFRGGVFFTPLDQVHSHELVASEIAKSMGVQQTADQSQADALRSHLRQHCVARTLLLIDNFEHVLEAGPLLTELLAASEQFGIVVTSRAALRVYGEHEFHVAPLDVPDLNADAAMLAEAPAIRLFLDRATSLRGDIDDKGVRAVAEICERLDGLPLAIELAAARTKVLTLAELLVRLRDPLQLLSGGPRDLPARQRTLRATLEWSYKLLDESHRKLFRRLSVFVGGATLEAIEAVCNVNDDLDLDVIGGVESLVDNSLLQSTDTDGSEPRFSMLGTMREYVSGELAAAGEDAHAHRAHAAYFLVLAEESSYTPTALQRDALYDRFELESGNLRAALDWLTATRDAVWGLRLANSLGHYWLQRGRASEGYERTCKLLELYADENDLLVWALAWAGDLAVSSARPEEANYYHEKSLALARKLDLVPGVLRALNAVAVQTQQEGQFDRSKAYHEEAISISREAGGSPALIGGMLSNYADHAMLRGDYALAQELQEETAQLFRDVGDEAALAWSLNHQGDIARRRRDFDVASRLYEESLAKFRLLEERSGIAACLYDLGGIAIDTGDCQRADQLNCEALSLYADLGSRSALPRVLEALTHCALESGDYRRALTLAGGAAAMRRALSLQIQETAQADLDRGLDRARQQMDGSEAARSWMAGWAMPADRVIEYALKQSEARSPNSA